MANTNDVFEFVGGAVRCVGASSPAHTFRVSAENHNSRA
jgi:hypothetical protein